MSLSRTTIATRGYRPGGSSDRSAIATRGYRYPVIGAIILPIPKGEISLTGYAPGIGNIVDIGDTRFYLVKFEGRCFDQYKDNRCYVVVREYHEGDIL